MTGLEPTRVDCMPVLANETPRRGPSRVAMLPRAAPASLMTALSVLCSAPVATAQEAGPAPAETASPAPPPEWYGWQILITDGVAISGIVAGVAADSESLTTLGVFYMGGPVVHWSHGYSGRGWESLGLRLGLPLVGALAGVGVASAATECHGFGCLGGAPVGAGVGALGAMALDVTCLAWEDPPQSTRVRTTASPLTVSPTLELAQDWWMVVIHATL